MNTTSARLATTMSTWWPGEHEEAMGIGPSHVHRGGVMVRHYPGMPPEPAMLAPAHRYFVGRNRDSEWVLASDLDGWNVIGEVTSITDIDLVPGMVYAIEHVDTSSTGCGFTIVPSTDMATGHAGRPLPLEWGGAGHS